MPADPPQTGSRRLISHPATTVEPLYHSEYCLFSPKVHMMHFRFGFRLPLQGATMSVPLSPRSPTACGTAIICISNSSVSRAELCWTGSYPEMFHYISVGVFLGRGGLHPCPLLRYQVPFDVIKVNSIQPLSLVRTPLHSKREERNSHYRR